MRTALLVIDMLNPYDHEHADVLAEHVEPMGVETVVLTGQVTEQCILYTALDAYVRNFAIRVPRDAVAAIDDELGAAALSMMERNMRVDVLCARDCLRARR